jgi:arylsulfatase
LAEKCVAITHSEHPDRVVDMARQYDAWAARCGVLPREQIVALMGSQGVTRAFWEKDE